MKSHALVIPYPTCLYWKVYPVVHARERIINLCPYAEAFMPTPDAEKSSVPVGRKITHLVGGIPTHLKKMSSSVGMIIHYIYIWKNKNVPKHQPVIQGCQASQEMWPLKDIMI